MHVCSETENKIILVGLSEGTIGGKREKENLREWKILKQPIDMWI
jgi:hypothetical protein